ncbi:sensor histidine kinase [Cesiribacter andamanensis]|uniref:histidine kinase n=1 Tax=Cesiribacter andamanensis AMV16 TaxID=1279009 RepID=M7NGL9_9BACT|nr:PAS domain-containing sensor histidine kinase [Cesiribacter andamanensis]EMR00980.1 Phytochrome-like protein cph1 [Cesiribacter andamanensis AMV16]
MTHIAYTGLEETSLAILRQQLELPEGAFAEFSEDKAGDLLPEQSRKLGVFLIGERVGNPIKLAQKIHAQDQFLSILILNDKSSYTKIKQALLFTPFIGNTVQPLANDIGAGLADTVRNAMARTQQRRQYQQLRTGSPAPRLQSNTHLYEDVKAEYLDKFLEEAPIGAVLMTEMGVILAVNRHASQILGVTEKQLIGSPFVRLFDEKRQRILESFFSKEFVGSATLTTERSTFRGKKYLEVRIARISIKAGLPYKIGILTDFTEKVQAQLKVEQQLEELRTMNEQLKMANEDLDAFVYTASHDLKAPIANIEGLIELLRRRVDAADPHLQSLFQMVELSIGRFQGTIKDLTEVALIPRRSQEQEQAIDALEIIEEVQMLIREMIVSSEAQIEVSCDPGLQLLFSRSNFRSIIYNLLTNSLKYRSPERSPRIRIAVEKQPPYTLLTVEDNGMGIAPDKQDKIFAMFKRLHTHIEGTGIGLFIIKRIVDSTEGKIEVESTEGQGTAFRIYLKDKAEAAVSEDLLPS